MAHDHRDALTDMPDGAKGHPSGYESGAAKAPQGAADIGGASAADLASGANDQQDDENEGEDKKG